MTFSTVCSLIEFACLLETEEHLHIPNKWNGKICCLWTLSRRCVALIVKEVALLPDCIYPLSTSSTTE